MRRCIGGSVHACCRRRPAAAPLPPTPLPARTLPPLPTLQPRRALELAAAALKLDPANLLALFVAGQAQSALGAAAAAADAFRRAVALTSGAAPGSHAHQLHMAAADNLLLECGTALPSDWLAALHDAPRLAALQAAIAEAVQAVGSGGARVLVCGGLGVEAVLAAQAGAAAVTCYCAGNPLTAALAGQLAADSGCGARVATATSAAQLDSRPGGFNLVVLADALGCSLDWAQLRATLAAAAPRLAPGAALLPHTVHVRGMLVQCEEADALNEVRTGGIAGGHNPCSPPLPAERRRSRRRSAQTCLRHWLPVEPTKPASACCAGGCRAAVCRHGRHGSHARQRSACAPPPLRAPALLRPHAAQQHAHAADGPAGELAARRSAAAAAKRGALGGRMRGHCRRTVLLL